MQGTGRSQFFQRDEDALRPGGPGSHLIRLEVDTHPAGHQGQRGKIVRQGLGAVVDHAVPPAAAQTGGKLLPGHGGHDLQSLVHVLEDVHQPQTLAGKQAVGQRDHVQIAVGAAGIGPDLENDAQGIGRGTRQGVGAYELAGREFLLLPLKGQRRQLGLEGRGDALHPVGHVAVHVLAAQHGIGDGDVRLARPGNAAQVAIRDGNGGKGGLGTGVGQHGAVPVRGAGRGTQIRRQCEARQQGRQRKHASGPATGSRQMTEIPRAEHHTPQTTEKEIAAWRRKLLVEGSCGPVKPCGSK